ncbi:hypothetical protein HY948_04645 [Candidatus Gottesmanbacteria bacterium]|nr:hypothetical protein [Candidatus Gottesmanbacteria bacterium]
MKKILILGITLFLFWIAYQVRLEFVATGDYNEPSDAKEYRLAAIAVNNLWRIAVGSLVIEEQSAFIAALKHNFAGANTHGSPLYNVYVAVLENAKWTPRDVAPILNAGFVSALFLTALKLFPLWIALAVGLVGAFYTPFFAFIYSWMPEQITGVALQLTVFAISWIVLRKKHLYWFVGAGFILFIMGLIRHVFTYYGMLFIGLPLLMDRTIKRKNLYGLIAGYAIPVIAWNAMLTFTGTSIYGVGGIASTFMNAHTLATDGWWMDGIKVSGWMDMFSRLLLRQNMASLFILELERVSRLWRHAANSYATSFPFADQRSLQLLHAGILFLAAWGTRAALRHRFMLLISSMILWNTVFVSLYYVEEIRYQMPVLGILLLLAGAGIEELRFLWNYQSARKSVLSLCGLFLSWILLGPYILGIELRIIPLISDSRVWRIVNFLVSGVIVVWALRMLWKIDRNAKLIIAHHWAKKLLPSVLIVYISIVIAPEIRSRNWHEWRKPLNQGEEIHQEITLGNEALSRLRDLNGYLIMDIQDPNATQFLTVMLNGQELFDRVPMMMRMSPVDLRAVRQWQRTLPRLGGYAGVEDALAEAAAWPNFREWLAIPIQGTFLEKENQIIVKNNAIAGGSLPYFFGDYPPYGTQLFYEGPTARLFQGPRTHNKYQVEGDMRLTERRPLQSIANKSTFVIGRFRIFFLFPYHGGDPEDLF